MYNSQLCFARGVTCLLLSALLLAAGCTTWGSPDGRPVQARGLQLAESYDPVALFLTWQQDPTTTMTIDWHVTEEDIDRPAILQYQKLDENQWRETQADLAEFPFSERSIQRVELTGLDPDSTYRFRFGGGDSPVYQFRTMPETQSRPIIFAAGGDTRHRQEWMEATNRIAMQHDLDFVTWGGDLAYANGHEDNADRWHEWFDAIKNTLITEDRRVVPVLVSIGNHEVRGGSYTRYDDYAPTDEFRKEIAPYFYRILAFPGQPGYRALDFGNYLTLIALDTNHTNPIEGAQTQWLEQALADRVDVPHIFPIYHVPAYPSVRAYDGGNSVLVRDNWVPLFERYGVRVTFENHDHAYKRTVPIREEKVDPHGIMYLGDGAWGVGIRTVHPADETWYLARSESARHAIIVTLDGDTQSYVMIDTDGEQLDEISLPNARTWTLDVFPFEIGLPHAWRFMWDPDDLGREQEWHAADFDDSAWHFIATGTPWHEQLVGIGWRQEHGENFAGVAWYRNRLDLTELERYPLEGTERLMLRFGAVDAAADVWINGTQVIERPFPFEDDADSWRKPFEVDITEHIREDAPNLVAVRVDSVNQRGGIIQPVRVQVKKFESEPRP